MYFNNKLKDGSELKYSAAQIHEKCLEVEKKKPTENWFNQVFSYMLLKYTW